MKDNNSVRISLLGIILVLPVVLESITVIFKGVFSSLSLLIYLIVLIIILQKSNKYSLRIKKKDVGILLTCYFVFAINYCCFTNTRAYITEKAMLIVFFFFLPICVFIIKNIDNWNNFEEILFPFASFSVALGSMIVFVYDHSSLSYMEFSYSILPFLPILYMNARLHINKAAIATLFFSIGIVEILSFGARGPLLFVLLFIIAFELFRQDVSVKMKAMIISINTVLILSLVLLDDYLMDAISKIPLFEKSYIVWNYHRGNLFEHSTRDTISKACMDRLSTMGFEVGGFFSDRQYCGSVYPHNFIYEILMSWGWIIGLLILLYLLNLIVNSCRDKKDRLVAWFLLLTLFSRYLVSGSYIIEGRFWIFLFAMFSIYNSKKLKDRER